METTQDIWVTVKIVAGSIFILLTLMPNVIMAARHIMGYKQS